MKSFPRRNYCGTSKARQNEISLGIAICHARTKPGQCRTLAEIAARANCNRQTISKLEVSALAKLRKWIESNPDPVLAEIVTEFLGLSTHN